MNARLAARTAANGGVAPTADHNASTYNNWRCGCLTCREAWRLYYRDYKERRRKGWKP